MSDERGNSDLTKWLHRYSPSRDRRAGPSVFDVLDDAKDRGLDPTQLDCPINPKHQLDPMIDSVGTARCRECDRQRVRRSRAAKKKGVR